MAVSGWQWDVGSGLRRKVSTFSGEAGDKGEVLWAPNQLPPPKILLVLPPLAFSSRYPGACHQPPSSPAASTVLLLSLCPVLQPRPQPATSLQHKSDHLTSTPETLQWLLTEPRVQPNLLLPILLAWQRPVTPPTLTPLLSLAPHPQCHSLVAAPRGSVSPSDLRHCSQTSQNASMSSPRLSCLPLYPQSVDAPSRVTPWPQLREGLTPQTNT